jgi:hypothetical protein
MNFTDTTSGYFIDNWFPNQTEPNKLKDYLNEKGWDCDWDYDNKVNDSWYNIYFEGKPIMQIETKCTPEQVEKDIKSLCPNYDGTLQSIKNDVGDMYVYIEKE